MSGFELAQLNVATMKAPPGSPVMADFVGNLDRINRLAEESGGYRWRLQTDEGNAPDFLPFGEYVLVNLCVSQDLETLRSFVFSSDHVQMKPSESTARTL